MRPHTADLRAIIETGGMQVRKEAHLYYGTERRIINLPLSSPQLRWDAGALVQGSGSCTVVWSDPLGASLSPSGIGDPLAPFGAELQIIDVLRAGTNEWRVPLGWFRITEVPDAADSTLTHQGRPVTLGSIVELTLQDRMAVLQEDRFDLPESTSQLGSVWAEIARLTRMPIVQAIPDAAIPTRVIYPEAKLPALYDLGKVIDAVPFMTADGILSARPRVWPEPVWDWRYGPPIDGRPSVVGRIGRSMSADGVYNKVVVRSHGSQDAQVLYSTEVREGALRTTLEDGTPAPAGTKPYFLSSQYVTTYEQAKAWGDRELNRLARLAAREVPIRIGYNPLVEVGDVARITDTRTRQATLVRVTEVPMRGTGPMDLTVEVAA